MRSGFPRSHLLSTMKSLKHEEYIISSQTCTFFGSAPSLSHESGTDASAFGRDGTKVKGPVFWKK